MKKGIFALLISLVLILGFAGLIFAEEATKTDEQVQQKPTSSVIALAVSKNDMVMPDKGDAYWIYGSFIYGWYHQQIGIGTDFRTIPDKNYTEIKPIVSLNKGPHFLIAGFKSTSAETENQYAQLGYWYFKSTPEYRLLVDVRNYFDIGGDKSTYLESCVEYVKWFGRIGVGPTATFDYWWQKDRKFVDMGPIAYYVLLKDPFIAPFVRYQHEWKSWEGKSSQTDYVRFGVYMTFK